jgi:hypothetical protein
MTQGGVPASAIHFAGQVGYSTTVRRISTPPAETPLPLWAQNPELAALDSQLLGLLHQCRNGRTTLGGARKKLWSLIAPFLEQVPTHVE